LVSQNSARFNKHSDCFLVPLNHDIWATKAKILLGTTGNSPHQISIIQSNPPAYFNHAEKLKGRGSDIMSDGDKQIADIMKPEQAASLLGISKKTLHRLCREGRIGYVKINDKHRGFRRDQIHDYIERRTVQPRIDNSLTTKVHSPRKGGDKKKSIRDSRADLRKEMSQWQ
jgi:excisionase family DNA binding protein